MIALRSSSVQGDSTREAGEEVTSALHGARRTLAMAGLLAALALVVLSAAVTNVALPALAGALGVPPAASVRVITVYQLGLVTALLPCAALGESLGHRRVFTAGVALFTLASLLCALAPSLSWLLAARFLQGLGGAAVMALGIALMRLVVPRRRLAAAIGWNALTVALASAVGPTLGALLLAAASLPCLFAINAPLGALVLLATRALPSVEGTARALDARSIALNAVVFTSMITGVELTVRAPALASLALAASGLSLVALIRRELPKQAPLVPLDLLRTRSFCVSVLASICCFAGQTLALVALPFHLQHGLRLDALTTGLMITPWPLGAALAAPLAGRLADRVSSAPLCALGAVCLSLGLSLAALWPLHGEPLALAPFLMLCGAGFALFQVPNNRNMLLAAPRARSGAAGGMQGTARLIGQTLGALMMTLLFALASTAAAPRVGLAAAALLTLSAGLVGLLAGENDRRGVESTALER